MRGGVYWGGVLIREESICERELDGCCGETDVYIKIERSKEGVGGMEARPKLRQCMAMYEQCISAG